MHNGPKKNVYTSAETSGVICCPRQAVETSAVRTELKHCQNAQGNYERYLALARAEALTNR